MKRFFPIILIIFISIPALWPLFQPGFFPSHDSIHIPRLYELDKNLKDGQFPVRWVADFRYGEPTFNFYAPLPFYVGSAVHTLGFNLLVTIKILIGLGFVLSGLAMFYLARELWGEQAGIVAAALYIYAPYHSVDLYVRGALSEALALIFFPLIFLFCYRIIQGCEGARRNIIGLGLSLAGLYLTHNILTVLFLPFILGWTVLLIWNKPGKLMILSKLVVSFSLGFGLAAFFLLPAFFEREFIQNGYLTQGYFDYRAHFVTLKEFFITKWGYGASLWGPEDDMSFQIGLIHWGGLVVSILYVVLRRIKNKKLSGSELLIIPLLGAFLFSLYMQHNKSNFIWEAIPLMRFTQFPWRFLGISIFLVSLIGVGFINQCKVQSAKGKVFLGFLILVIIGVNISYFQPQRYDKDDNEQNYISKSVLQRDDKLPKDYLPVWVKNINTKTHIEMPEIITGQGSLYNYQTRGVTASLAADLTENSLIKVPISYFPGWVVTDFDKPVAYTEPSDLGLIQIQLSPGHHQLNLKFADTPIRLIGNLITLGTFILLLSSSLWKRLKVF